MKTKLVLIQLFIPILLSGQVNPDSGLIACYPFNSNADDMTGNNHHGTVYGAALTTDRFGNAQNAYDYDGVDDYINIGAFNTFTQADEFSISVWIQANLIKPQTILMLQPDDFSDRFNAMAFYDHIGSSSTIWDYGNCTAGGRLINVGTIFTSAWQHYVFTVSQTNGMRVYTNGVLTDSLATSSTIVNRLRDLWIGGGIDVSNVDFYFDGAIDDMRLYERALNAAEAQFLYSLELMCEPTAISESSYTAMTYSVTASYGNMIFRSPANNSPAEVRVYSPNGTVLYSRKNVKGGETLSIPIPVNGLLLYSIKTVSGYVTGKLASIF